MPNKLNIVIADDDADDQSLIKDAFAAAKIPANIYQVFDGLQLLEFLHREYKYSHISVTPDMVLLDLNMPLMFGFEVLKQMKKDPKLKEIPVYIITTSNSTAEREFALELGAAGFFHKGASSKDIADIVRELCVAYF
jgi:two-component system, response regulator